MSTRTQIKLVLGRVGELLVRSDAEPKVNGQFAYASDLRAEGMLWGVTVRSPHPHARIRGIDVAAAVATQGVHAVLTSADVPGRHTYGVEVADQPVLAWDEVRYEGEPVAVVAAVDLETARLAAAKVEVDYEVLEPVTDAAAGEVLRAVSHPPRRAGDGRRRGRHRQLRGRHAGPGVPRARVGPRDPGRGRRRRPARRDAVAARRPRPGLRVARTRAGSRPAAPRRRRRRVRRPRGRVDPDPRVPARAAHEAAREDGLQPRGVVLRPRPPAPGVAAVRARRHAGGRAGLRQGRRAAGRRRVHVVVAGRGLERRVLRGRPVPRAERRDRRARRVHEQPALRRDAGVRRRPGRGRARGADGPAGRRRSASIRSTCGCATRCRRAIA